jgi:hypothetical protein
VVIVNLKGAATIHGRLICFTEVYLSALGAFCILLARVLFTASNAILVTPVLSQIRHYRKPVALPPLTPEQREIIVGCCLGDLNIQKGKGALNARLLFEQGYCEYIMHLYSLFQSYCGTPPRESSYVHSQTGRTHGRITFNTLSSPVFTEFYDIFYLDGVKTVPANIAELLTSRSLAFWAMDDGYKSGPGFVLSTNLSLVKKLNFLALYWSASLIYVAMFVFLTAMFFTFVLVLWRLGSVKFKYKL